MQLAPPVHYAALSASFVSAGAAPRLPPAPSPALATRGKRSHSGTAERPQASKKQKRKPRDPLGKGGASLVCLLQALVGQRIRVELRNETDLRGKLESVSPDMTMRLFALTELPPRGRKRRVESLTVPGKQIRYVHIPDSVDIGRTLDAYERKLVKAKSIYERRKRKDPAREAQKRLQIGGERIRLSMFGSSAGPSLASAVAAQSPPANFLPNALPPLFGHQFAAPPAFNSPHSSAFFVAMRPPLPVPVPIALRPPTSAQFASASGALTRERPDSDEDWAAFG